MNRTHTRPHQWRVVTVFQLLFGLLLSFSALGQPAFLTNGLVAYYPFNGNANDESGNNHSGQASGIQYGGDRFGFNNKAAQFTTNEERKPVVVPRINELLLPNGSITVSLWANIKSYKQNSNMQIIGFWGAFDMLVAGDGRLVFQKFKSDRTWAERLWINYSMYGQYAHVIYRFDGQSGSVIVNGEIVKPFRDSGDGGTVPLSDLMIGGTVGMPFQNLDGALDDVRIYNRALSDTEVKALYAYESTPPDNSFITNGLVAYYPFNGNANDESGNKRNALLVGEAGIGDDRFGSKTSALHLNGINGYVDLRANAFPEVTGAKPRTFSVWTKLDEINSGGNFINYGMKGYPNSTYTGATFAMYFNYYDPSVARFGFWANNIGLLYPGVTTRYMHHMVTYDGKFIRYYLDGKLLGTSESTLNTADDKIVLGLNLENQKPSFKGQIDDLRIYNRALSEGEVKALYDYESTPQSSVLNPRNATATSQVVNGFVVGATITDGGYGYTNNPIVTISGGGGSGAKATATQVNGVVTSITITNPGSGYTSVPTITIAPPPFPPRKATATSQVVNGFVVGATVKDGGFGYDTPPAVLLSGGGGSGATATATVVNGVVTGITITNPGTGYTSAPNVQIASPPFVPSLAIEVSKVTVRLKVVLGRKYQLEASTDLNTWAATSPAFVAQAEELVQEFDVNQVGRYFRINQVP